MTSFVRARAALALSLLIGALASCGDDEPSSSPLPSSSPTAHDTSSPPAPTTTAPEARPSPLRVVRAWVSAQNSSLRNGDTSLARELSAPDCFTCDQLLASVEGVYTAGGTLRGGRWTIDAARVSDRTEKSVTITAGITAAAGTSRDRSDAPEESFSEQQFAVTFEVSSTRSVVKRIVFLS